MHSKQNSLSLAVRVALSVGLASGAGAIHAQSTTPDGTDAPKDTKTLEAIEVTGSLLRRVDTETANPVVTLDRQTLENNGNPTLGNVLQSLPAFSGFATNPQNNSNGGGVASPTLEGGDGASRISLRGMGINRTLMLVDGHRLANPDINMLSFNMIERVEVLPQGATTAYGSDAIGGVANFILRKDFTGMEVSGDVGVSSEGDGHRHGISLTVGNSGDRGNVVGGLNYNKYNPVLASARDYSSYQYYLYASGPSRQGSSQTPEGTVVLPADSPLLPPYGCGSGNRVIRASGDGTQLSDYRCYHGSTDAFNYNAYNYIQTAQERTNGFVIGNYKITDALTYYADFFYNHTHSSGQDGPAPSNPGDGWYIAADNPNNPFGITFCSLVCPPGTTPTEPIGSLRLRLTGAGTRLHTFDTSTETLITGLKGVLANSWIWDLALNYGHSSRNQVDFHEINIAGFQAAIDAGGNPFAQETLPISITDDPEYHKTNTSKEVSFNINGDLFQMPAGMVQLSAGALYRKLSMDYKLTSDAVLDLTNFTCGILAEGCGSPGAGSTRVKEVFAEALFPLVEDAAFAKSLNIDVGVRYSDYDISGGTTNWKAAVEWRPVEDLLVRGTVSQVFRAPNPDELFDGPTATNPTVIDPCLNQPASYLAAHQGLCQYVPVNWNPSGYGQITGLYEGGAVAGLNLRPEHGKSFDFGFVYSPTWWEGFSGSLDFWRITLDDLLTPLAAQTVLDNCATNDASPYCGLIFRYSGGVEPGSIYYISAAETNLGSLRTSGFDLNLSYRLPEFFLPGRFMVAFNSTYTGSYKVNIPGGTSADYAGSYTQQYGNLARVRASVTLNWNFENWSAQWQTRYIDHFNLLNAYIDPINLPAGVSSTLPRSSVTYHAAKVGYVIPGWKTSIDVGVDNIGNRTPPIIYQNGLNYNVDTATYDTLGRYYWGRVTVRF
jgi:outer membrane receptor protein involved in Fe transport